MSVKSKLGKQDHRDKDSEQHGLVNFRPEVAQAVNPIILMVFVF